MVGLIMGLLLQAASGQPLPEQSFHDPFDAAGSVATSADALAEGLKHCGGEGPCANYNLKGFDALEWAWRRTPATRAKIREAALAERRPDGSVNWWAASDRYFGDRNPIYVGPAELASRQADLDAYAMRAERRWRAECRTKRTRKGAYETSCQGW